MIRNPTDIWPDDISVIFTSFWGWSPETWGTIGWTGSEGLSHRTKLLRELTDPFIAVIYVTQSAGREEDQNGKIVGFYLVSHETGHRDKFTDPSHHALAPKKWEHSLRAIRAFSYIPEYRIKASDFDPTLAKRARPVSKWGELLTDAAKIDLLRSTPWIESNVYVPIGQAIESSEDFEVMRGFTRAGPANRNGYVVSSSAQDLKRQLYIFCLTGSTDAFLGEPANGAQIYKIGLSASPELRRQCLQSYLPKGAFSWSIYRQSEIKNTNSGLSFKAAVAGEDAMKEFLAQHAVWLGGEFYLATEPIVLTSWKLGNDAANAFPSS